MPTKRIFQYFTVVFFLAFTSTASAAPKDRAASEKIDEAINVHYLVTAFDKAEALLTGTINACGDQCSPSVIARAWMYVGIIRGSGHQDLAGAKEAFGAALSADPSIKLDTSLATPQVSAAFDAQRKAIGGSAPPPTGPAPKPQPSGGADTGELPGDMSCSPDLSEIESRRAIPVACDADDPADLVELKYKEFGGELWVGVKMRQKGDHWVGEIPCKATSFQGTLRWYVRAKDDSGDTIDSYGSRRKPVEVEIVGETDEDPPHLPDQDPPQRCADASDCPEEMLGTPACPGTSKPGEERGDKPWGASCDEDAECESELYCIDGSCESAPNCDSSADCSSGACVDGVCSMDDGGESREIKQHWIGAHFGFDLVFLPQANDVCHSSNADFGCYNVDNVLITDVDETGLANGSGGTIKSSGFAQAATMRAMLSYDFALTPNIQLGALGGFAFGGAPGNFNPIHVEGRASYWFGAVGGKGIRGFVMGGGGLGQVDGAYTVAVIKSVPPTAPAGTPGEGAEYVAYRQLGVAFATAGAGLMYAITPSHGPVVTVQGKYMLPAAGMVLQPSVGYRVGF